MKRFKLLSFIALLSLSAIPCAYGMAGRGGDGGGGGAAAAPAAAAPVVNPHQRQQAALYAALAELQAQAEQNAFAVQTRKTWFGAPIASSHAYVTNFLVALRTAWTAERPHQINLRELERLVIDGRSIFNFTRREALRGIGIFGAGAATMYAIMKYLH